MLSNDTAILDLPLSDTESLARNGYILLVKSDYETALGSDLFKAALCGLQASYEDLTIDQHMKDNGRYRFRRFASLRLHAKSGTLTPLPPAPFFQTKDVNALNGGIPRNFDPVKAEVLGNPLLAHIIRSQFALLPNRDIASNWRIHIHQIRIIGTPTEVGKPTPEGIHQDGHHYIGMVLLNRVNVNGAVSRIFDSARWLTEELTLRSPLDSILVDDKQMFHEVTPITPRDANQKALRDMLLIDFNPELLRSFDGK